MYELRRDTQKTPFIIPAPVHLIQTMIENIVPKHISTAAQDVHKHADTDNSANMHAFVCSLALRFLLKLVLISGRWLTYFSVSYEKSVCLKI